MFKTIITNTEALRMPKQANAKQRKWMRDISDFIYDNGLGILYGKEFEGRMDFQLHHVLGRTARHNKVPIGHWFIIPVPVELHDVDSNHSDNVTHFKKNFVKRFGKQSQIFHDMCQHIIWNNLYHDVPGEVYDAIMDTNA